MHTSSGHRQMDPLSEYHQVLSFVTILPKESRLKRSHIPKSYVNITYCVLSGSNIVDNIAGRFIAFFN